LVIALFLINTIPISELVVTTAMARPELISPPDVSEADEDWTGLAAGLGDLDGLGFA
jgi:hypothetical protein